MGGGVISINSLLRNSCDCQLYLLNNFFQAELSLQLVIEVKNSAEKMNSVTSNHSDISWFKILKILISHGDNCFYDDISVQFEQW